MAEPTSMKFVSCQVVSLTTTSAQSSAIGSSNAGQTFSEVVRICSTADCWIAIDSNPTAVAASGTASFLLPAGVVEYVDMPAGYKVAGILASGTGTLSVSRMQK